MKKNEINGKTAEVGNKAQIDYLKEQQKLIKSYEEANLPYYIENGKVIQGHKPKDNGIQQQMLLF